MCACVCVSDLAYIGLVVVMGMEASLQGSTRKSAPKADERMTQRVTPQH